MTCFTALAETDLIQIEDDNGDYSAIRVSPVIGWQHTTGAYATPILAYPSTNPTAQGLAVEHPDGSVTDFFHKKTFLNANDWVEFIVEKINEQVRMGGDAQQPEDPAPAKETASGKPKEREPVEVIFGGKTYKTKSYWYHKTSNTIFEIEPDEVIPEDPNCIKIKRDDVSTYRKDGARYSEAVPFRVEEPTYATNDAAGEPDDDGSDLI